MPLFSLRSKKKDINALPENFDQFIEYVYVSGFNYAWGIANPDKRKPSARQQYRKWLDKLKKGEAYKEFHTVTAPNTNPESANKH